MGEIESLWNYAEHQDMDQLGQKLLCTTLELEKLKSEKTEEMKKYKEYVNKLIVVLKSAIQERDEARRQLENLISKIVSTSVTESNSLSETVESLFHPQDLSSLSIHEESNNLIIDNLAKARVLPQRGMFVQAIIDAGPLLQTRLLAGPLPSWRNPPHLHPFQIPPPPPVSMAGYANFGCVRKNDCFGMEENDDSFGMGKRLRFC